MTPTSDPVPSFTPFRVVVFLAGLVSIISALPSVSPDIKVILSVVSGALSLVLSVFFNAGTSISFYRRAMNRVRGVK
jgi:hypothetical protein